MNYTGVISSGRGAVPVRRCAGPRSPAVRAGAAVAPGWGRLYPFRSARSRARPCASAGLAGASETIVVRRLSGTLRGWWRAVRDRSTTDLRRPSREAHLPAQQPPPVPSARIPASHVRSRRARRAEGAPSQGSEQAVGLIGRISERSTFVALRRDGRRVRSGPIWIRVLPDDPADPPRPPRLACAFGRRTGRAVTRNLLRRRVRGAFEARAQREPASIPPGAYLVGGGPEVAGLPYASLARHVDACLDRVVGR